MNSIEPSVAAGMALMILATVAGAWIHLRTAPRTGAYRRSWQLLGGAMAAWGGGTVLALSLQALDIRWPAPLGATTPAHVGYVASMALFSAGVVLNPALSPRVVRLRALANAIIVAASATTVMWFLAARTLHARTGDPRSTAVILAYPAIDVVLVHLAATTFRRVRYTDAERFVTARAVAKRCTLGFLAFAVSDLRELVVYAHGWTAGVPLLTEIGWAIGIALLVDAARVARASTRELDPASVSGRRPEDDRTLATALGLAPVAAAIIAGGVALVDVVVSGRIDPTGVLMLSAVVSMVLARQSLTVSDNRLLGLELRRAVEDLEHHATHDGLTGLPNRAGLTERIRATVAAQSESGCAALLFVDLDHLKPVNDSLGHAAGDELLRATAGRLTDIAGANVTRFGGDEFVVLLDDLPALDTAASAELIGRRLVESAACPVEVEGHLIRPSVSVGIAIAEPDITPEELMRRADLALYRAKATGRRRAATYDPDLNVDTRQLLDLELELRRAIRNDEFEVHYQPVVKLRTGEVSGVESLLRWRHPTRGLLGPDAFLDAAAACGLLGTIGERTLMRACADVASLRSASGRSCSVAVNLSTTELTDRRVVQRVRTALETFGLPPASLVIEINEDVVVDDTIRNTIDELRSLGVLLSIDDFGTGNSSLRQLGTYPARTLKIDRSFVARLGEDERATAIVKAILGLARNLGLATVAEGVETPAQAQSLLSMGCDFGQGWLFARALPIDELRLHLAAPAPAPRRWEPTDTPDAQAPSRSNDAVASATMRSSSSATGGRSPMAPTT